MNVKKCKLIVYTLLMVILYTATASFFAQASPFDNNIISGIANRTYNTRDTGNPEDVFINTLGSIIFMLISFLGIMFILLIMYGGYIWMNARGNESDVQKAQHIIRDAVIGLVVLGASYGAWILIYSLLFGEWVAQ